MDLCGTSHVRTPGISSRRILSILDLLQLLARPTYINDKTNISKPSLSSHLPNRHIKPVTFVGSQVFQRGSLYNLRRLGCSLSRLLIHLTSQLCGQRSSSPLMPCTNDRIRLINIQSDRSETHSIIAKLLARLIKKIPCNFPQLV